MLKEKTSFLMSCKYALKGLYWFWAFEAKSRIHLVLVVLVTIFGFYFEISSVQWALQMLCIGLVVGMELVNTSIERLSDLHRSERSQSIAVIKDLAAGAVMIASISAITVALLIYLPIILQLFG